MYSDIDLLCGAKQNTLSGGRATITILWPHRGTNCYSETIKKMPFFVSNKKYRLCNSIKRNLTWAATTPPKQNIAQK